MLFLWMFAEMSRAHRIREVDSNAYVHSEVLATGFRITMDDELDKFPC